jgi:predicted permease
MGIPYETAFVTRLVTIVGVPCLIFSTLVKANITPDELATMGFASLASVVIFAAIAVPSLRFYKLKQKNLSARDSVC